MSQENRENDERHMIAIAKMLEDARAAGYSLQDCGGVVTLVAMADGRSGLLLYPDNTAFWISGRADVTVNSGTRDVAEMRRLLGLRPMANDESDGNDGSETK